MEDRTRSIYWALRLTYGLVPLLAGLDKFVGLLADWPTYLSPFAVSLLPLEPATFMHVVGVVEIAVGALVLVGITRLGALVAMGWLLAIATNLALAGVLDVAVRDVAMSVGAFALSRLAALRGEALVPGRAEALEPQVHGA